MEGHMLQVNQEVERQYCEYDFNPNRPMEPVEDSPSLISSQHGYPNGPGSKSDPDHYSIQRR